MIVAVPVASPIRLREVRRWCDDVVCLLAPDDVFAIGQYYANFDSVQSEEVVRLLRAFGIPQRAVASASPAAP
jgi:predicted phosphoribosyltransferase